MPPKAPPLAENGDTKITNAVRLAQIEQQLVFLNGAINTLGDKIDNTENTRGINLLEYVKQHGEVVADAKEANKKVDALKIEFYASKLDTDDSFEVLEKRFDDWDDKIGPLLTVHKVLVWVTIFFASSIGLLLWGIFTHTVSLSFVK